MRARERVALAGAVVLTSPLVVPVLASPADAATLVFAAPRNPDKPDRKQDDKRDENRGRQDKQDERKPKPKPDRVPPATPTLGDAGVGPGGAVSLPIIAESGSYVAVSELGGPVVATGTGVGGYSSLAWRTTHGQHTYAVTATDRAGNRSGVATTGVSVDAVPPRLRGLRLTPGTPSDTRTRVVFGTDTGSAYRVLAGGRQVARGITADTRAERWLDLADGRQRVQVIVRDGVGNARSLTRPVVVRIPELAVRGGLASEPTVRRQAVRVRATPTATRGIVRLRGQDPVTFELRRGRATVTLKLPDGSYGQGVVAIRDTRGRTGRTRLPALTVDTTPPTLDVTLDEDAAADGVLGAAVTADDGADLRWSVVDAEGDVVRSGEVVTTDGEGTVTADVPEGTYRLVVTSTDAFDRTTTARSSTRVAEDPWPAWLLTLVVLGALTALVGLLLSLRRSGHPDSPVRQALITARHAVGRRYRALRAAVAARAATGSGVALPARGDKGPRVPLQRGVGRAGGGQPPEDEVLHRTRVRLYETTEERDDGPVLGCRTAELVLGRERISLVDDRTGDVWSGRIAVLAHVRDDTTMVLPVGEDDWIGLVYDDSELTRPALDLVAVDQTADQSADQSARPLAPAGTTGGG